MYGMVSYVELVWYGMILVSFGTCYVMLWYGMLVLQGMVWYISMVWYVSMV